MTKHNLKYDLKYLVEIKETDKLPMQLIRQLYDNTNYSLVENNNLLKQFKPTNQGFSNGINACVITFILNKNENTVVPVVLLVDKNNQNNLEYALKTTLNYGNYELNNYNYAEEIYKLVSLCQRIHLPIYSSFSELIDYCVYQYQLTDNNKTKIEIQNELFKLYQNNIKMRDNFNENKQVVIIEIPKDSKMYQESNIYATESLNDFMANFVKDNQEKFAKKRQEALKMHRKYQLENITDYQFNEIKNKKIN